MLRGLFQKMKQIPGKSITLVDEYLKQHAGESTVIQGKSMNPSSLIRLVHRPGKLAGVAGISSPQIANEAHVGVFFFQAIAAVGQAATHSAAT